MTCFLGVRLDFVAPWAVTDEAASSGNPGCDSIID